MKESTSTSSTFYRPARIPTSFRQLHRRNAPRNNHSERRGDMSKKLIATIWTTVALASAVMVAIPAAAADTGPPQQGGGCNMVFGPAFHSPNSNGLDNMMAGSGASANGIGARNMKDMLSIFSPYASTFCFP